MSKFKKKNRPEMGGMPEVIVVVIIILWLLLYYIGTKL